jgi:hypothetical protein
MKHPSYTVYTAITTGPSYMTQSKPNEDPTEALREAMELQLEETYEAFVVKIEIDFSRITEEFDVKTSVTQYEGDEAQRIIDGDTPS